MANFPIRGLDNSDSSGPISSIIELILDLMVMYTLTKFGADWLIFVDARMLTRKLWTDRWMHVGRTDRVTPVYPPNFVCEVLIYCSNASFSILSNDVHFVKKNFNAYLGPIKNSFQGD